LRLEVHAMRFEDDDELRAKEPTFATKPAMMQVKEGEEVVITAKDGIVRITIDGKPQGGGMSLSRWDYTAVALTYRDKEN
jgi:TusA-related sulfurtransferase